MIDRLVHHADVITLTGDSYRTRSRRELLRLGVPGRDQMHQKPTRGVKFRSTTGRQDSPPLTPGLGAWREQEASPPESPSWPWPVRTSSKSAPSDAPAARRTIGSTRSAPAGPRSAGDTKSSSRSRGLREALKDLAATRQEVLVGRTKAINELKSPIVVLANISCALRGRPLAGQPALIEGRATPAPQSTTGTATLTLQSTTARIRFLTARLADIDTELAGLIQAYSAGPALLAEPGVGPDVAAQLPIRWSHPARVRSEAAFASLAGVAPPEASSGHRTRHRLDPGGDRALDRSLHTVAITHLRCHAEARAHEARGTLQGKPPRHPPLPQAHPRPAPLPRPGIHSHQIPGIEDNRQTWDRRMGCCNSYFPKRTDLGIHTAEQLASLASVLNRRPRKFLGWASPLEHLNRPAYPARIQQPFAPTAAIRP
jgi:hypothetical protein